MSDTSKVAANMRAFMMAIRAHNRENPLHPPAYGIEVGPFDAERLGLEHGEEILPGITLVVNPNRQPHTFRTLCDYEAPRAATDAVSEHALQP